MFKKPLRRKSEVIELYVIQTGVELPTLSWELKPGEYVIGRAPSCDVIILDPTVSRIHARIFYSNGEWFIEDLGSTNGTIVDGLEARSGSPVKIKNGSKIVMGKTILGVRYK
ncbi:FHA domain-containing protein [Thermogladius sp. 4427co]|uniref:FHA domain-containing protein n=1 Tax=Thermogladius sp. 4427co TaxID=3450718 RepID=UPI003F78F0DC